MSASQANHDVTVLCAWCGTVLHVGGTAISHGICKDCAPVLLQKIRQRLKESSESEMPRTGNTAPEHHPGGES